MEISALKHQLVPLHVQLGIILMNCSYQLVSYVQLDILALELVSKPLLHALLGHTLTLEQHHVLHVLQDITAGKLQQLKLIC